MGKLQHTTTFRVRFNETDPLGIVWHGHYITYFEDGREDFGQKHGLSYLDIQKQGLYTPVVKCVCDYKSPLRYGDEATIETTFVPHTAAKIHFQYKIWHQSGRLVATGETIQVFTDTQGELQLTNPPFFEAWKRAQGL
jgi:acyl-CoA thioester hydrolase